MKYFNKGIDLFMFVLFRFIESFKKIISNYWRFIFKIIFLMFLFILFFSYFIKFSFALEGAFNQVKNKDIYFKSIEYNPIGKDKGNEWIKISVNGIIPSFLKENNKLRKIEIKYILKNGKEKQLVNNITFFNGAIYLHNNPENFLSKYKKNLLEESYQYDILLAKTYFYLNNKGELIELLDDNNKILDSVNYINKEISKNVLINNKKNSNKEDSENKEEINLLKDNKSALEEDIKIKKNVNNIDELNDLNKINDFESIRRNFFGNSYEGKKQEKKENGKKNEENNVENIVNKLDNFESSGVKNNLDEKKNKKIRIIINSFDKKYEVFVDYNEFDGFINVPLYFVLGDNFSFDSINGIKKKSNKLVSNKRIGQSIIYESSFFKSKKVAEYLYLFLLLFITIYVIAKYN